MKSVLLSISVHLIILGILININTNVETPIVETVTFIDILEENKPLAKVNNNTISLKKIENKAEFSEKTAQLTEDIASSKTASSTSNFGYPDQVIAKLEKVKRYPSQALKRRIEGSLILNLKINSSGDVENYQIAQSSGFDAFDKEALKMVERATPFPSFQGNIQEYQIPISFKLS